MTAEREGADVEAVLAAHFTGSDPRTHESTCTCGWRGPLRLGDWAGALADKTAHIAEALAPLIAERERLAAERALREAADAWQVGGWSNVLLPKPAPPAVPVIAYSNRVLDWLREQADTYAEGGE